MRSFHLSFSLLLFLLLSGQNVLAKEDTLVVYYDYDRQPCKKKEAAYIRKLFKLSDGTYGFYEVTRYTGRKVSTGGYLTEDTLIRHGMFKYYNNLGELEKEGAYENNKKSGIWRTYHLSGKKASEVKYVDDRKEGLYQSWYFNGQLQESCSYVNGKIEGDWKKFMNEAGTSYAVCNYEDDQLHGEYKHWMDTVLIENGSYVQGDKHGVWKLWHDNGKLESEGIYELGKKTGAWKTWHDNEQLCSEGDYKNGEKEGLWHEWFNDGQLDSKGVFINGKEEGEWNFYFGNGQLAAHEVYANGELKEVQWYHEDGSTQKFPGEPVIEPMFPGGESAMMLFIRENIEYPMVSVEKGEQGIVYVQFVVDKDGTIEQIKIVRSVSDALDEETIRVIKKMPKWNPGIYHGRLVRVRYTLPVHFRLG